MNPILLDTHAAIRSAAGIVPKAAASIVEQAAQRAQLLLSPITAWEVAMLAGKQRLHLTLPVNDYVRALFTQHGVLTAGLTPLIAAAAASLPPPFPKDPADRIIFATAQAYGADLMTNDKAIREYAKRAKTVRCIAC
jgi:PIN domain nuclease of toxin-antitoxin system